MSTMQTFNENYIVYVQTDTQNRITAINSSAFIDDASDWIKIDEGTGDKYHHAQNHYLDKPIYTKEGILRYKLVYGKPIERNQEEIQTEKIFKFKQEKIANLSATCEQTIYNGLELELSQGKETFEYKDKDQINIKAMFDAVIFGAEKYPYQSEDGKCRVFVKEDIKTLYSSLETLRTSQLTYYNQLKNYVNTLENIEEINTIIYGQELTGEYLEHYNEMMAVAEEQMRLVLSKIIN